MLTSLSDGRREADVGLGEKHAASCAPEEKALPAAHSGGDAAHVPHRTQPVPHDILLSESALPLLPELELRYKGD